VWRGGQPTSGCDGRHSDRKKKRCKTIDQSAYRARRHGQERRCGHVHDRFHASCGPLTDAVRGMRAYRKGLSMTAHIRHITFDRADPHALAGFWRQVTDYGEDPDNPNAPDDPEALLVAPDGGPGLLFIGSLRFLGEARRTKNRRS
jgi:hypothetical protein